VNISFSEILVVFVVALLLFGPEQLPQIARGFGKIAGELRKASNAVRREWYNAVYPPTEEIRRDMAAHTSELRALRAEVLAPPAGSVGSPSRKQSSQEAPPSDAPTATPQPTPPPSKEQE
jgi:Tat protein translocase TatB subunit